MLHSGVIPDGSTPRAESGHPRVRYAGRRVGPALTAGATSGGGTLFDWSPHAGGSAVPIATAIKATRKNPQLEADPAKKSVRTYLINDPVNGRNPKEIASMTTQSHAAPC